VNDPQSFFVINISSQNTRVIKNNLKRQVSSCIPDSPCAADPTNLFQFSQYNTLKFLINLANSFENNVEYLTISIIYIVNKELRVAMPFCPKCRYEYNLEISKCPDCDEYLVVTLPPKEKSVKTVEDDNHPDWIRLACLTSNHNAQMVVEGLRSKDIPVVLYSTSGHVGQISESFSFGQGAGYIILIPEEYVVDADKEAFLMLGEIWEKSKLFDIEE
jgi:hypothetical protein